MVLYKKVPWGEGNPGIMRSILCFFTRHRWSSVGVCLFCGQSCSHPVVVHDPGAHRTVCMDCGMLTPFPKTGQKGASTLRRWIQGRIERVFGWDIGPYS
jgi:hypothetical protein